MPRLPGRSEVFGGGGVCLVVVVVREGLEKRENRWREVVKTAPYPLLSCFLSVSSSTPPMLPKVGKEIKAGRHERHPWDSVFFGALSLCSLHYRYGNAESLAQPVPRLQRMPGLIRLSLSLCFFSRPPPRLTPSSSSASIRCSCLSLKQPSGFQVDSSWLAAAVTVSGTVWEWMSVSLAPGA